MPQRGILLSQSGIMHSMGVCRPRVCVGMEAVSEGSGLTRVWRSLRSCIIRKKLLIHIILTSGLL